jgi:hypothetical protein
MLNPFALISTPFRKSLIVECRSRSASTCLGPCLDYVPSLTPKQIYDSTGNDVPKTADVLNFVGILTHEQQVISSTTPARF